MHIQIVGRGKDDLLAEFAFYGRLAWSVYGVWKFGENADTVVVRWLATLAGTTQFTVPDGQRDSGLG